MDRARSAAALFGGDPDLQRPRPAGTLPGEHRAAPSGRSRPVDRSDRGRRRLDRRNGRVAGSRASRGPGGAARAERGLLRGRQCGHRRGSGPFHPVAQQRHRGDRGLDRGGPGPVRRSDGRLGRTAGPGPVRPRPGGFGRRFLLPWSAGRPSEATASPASSLPLGRSKRSSAPADRVRSTGRRPCVASGASIRSSARITRISTWPSACAGPVIGAVFAPRCVIHHDVSATYDHGSPALQRRMARNAEIVFWANMPPGLLTLALVPHLAFVALQGSLAAGPRPAAAVPAGQMRCGSRLAGDQGSP